MQAFIIDPESDRLLQFANRAPISETDLGEALLQAFGCEDDLCTDCFDVYQELSAQIFDAIEEKEHEYMAPSGWFEALMQYPQGETDLDDLCSESESLKERVQDAQTYEMLAHSTIKDLLGRINELEQTNKSLHQRAEDLTTRLDKIILTTTPIGQELKVNYDQGPVDPVAWPKPKGTY